MGIIDHFKSHGMKLSLSFKTGERKKHLTVDVLYQRNTLIVTYWRS